MTIANLETMTDMQSWCRTWPLNGSKHIRAKPKLHKKPRESCKSSWNPRGNLMSFTLTIPWNSAKLVNISPGIIARLRHTDRRLMVQEEAIVYVKELDIFLTMKVFENTPAVLLLGKLCDENGFSLRMDQWSKTTSH